MKRAPAEPLRDRQIRAALVSYLRKHDRSAVILHEVPLSRGDRRADVIRVNGSLEGYEIKSDQDSLDRLPAQAQEYEKVCEYLTVVIARRHLQLAMKGIGAHWGIIVAEQRRARVTFQVFREAERNHSLSSDTLVRMMWKTECLKTLRVLGVEANRHAPVIELWDLLSALPAETICAHLKDALKARHPAPSRSRRLRDDD